MFRDGFSLIRAKKEWEWQRVRDGCMYGCAHNMGERKRYKALKGFTEYQGINNGVFAGLCVCKNKHEDDLKKCGYNIKSWHGRLQLYGWQMRKNVKKDGPEKAEAVRIIRAKELWTHFPQKFKKYMPASQNAGG